MTIAKLLNTRKKSEQVERVQSLIDIAQSPAISVTVLMTPQAGVEVTALSSKQVSSSQVKQILQAALEKLTRMEVQAEQNKEVEEAEMALEMEQALTQNLPE